MTNAALLAPGSPPSSRGAAGRPITVGLLNNMPDAALRPTARQFERLLSGRGGVRLRHFHLPGLARGEAAGGHLRAVGSAPADMMADLDALVVTGSEPRAGCLRDEPYWDDLTRAIDWAQAHTVSTLFSCLAAHAAVLHLDGIGRRRLPEKCSGVFDCRPTGAHPLLAGLPVPLAVPHSRCNGLDEAELAARGYRVLTRSDAVGVDLFVKPGRSLLVFLQGHPEYDRDSLAREYRRDLGRHRDGLRPDRPALPAQYFDAATAARLRDDPGTGPLPDCPPPADARWQAGAGRLFANWLALVEAGRRQGVL
ncbi:homoserine O-acetyltransferase/O-succinyltransferase family protein [Methylobacterium oryzihabitans]|uniref:Homoserine O-succinyltransferase n=1 Tax=Methylobacterium oryzihabitans TaxID=2499852 RepID=A0A3S2XH96_9HYPH|nr:homoserine O-succinyltransferase [Methylobacterium oryzihabitans]RVU14725.1 homoserine O-succinyltransferase [Methylobacterium oryzihabitans]